MKHPDACHNYQFRLELLRKTLLSILQQKSKMPIQILIVTHQPIDLQKLEIEKDISDSKIHQVIIKLNPPKNFKRNILLEKECLKDKNFKYLIGLIHGKQFQPKYIMFFDSDDYIAQNTLTWIEENGSSHPIWIIDQGYMMNYQQKQKVFEINYLNRCCGTSLIIEARLFYKKLIPNYHQPSIKMTLFGQDVQIDLQKIQIDHLTPQHSHEQIFKMLDLNYIYFIIGSHIHLPKFLNALGIKAGKIPLRSTLYLINHQENVNQFAIDRLLTKEFPSISSDDIHDQFLPPNIPF